MRLVELDLTEVKGEQEIYRYLQEQMHLPDVSDGGRGNLELLSEALEDLTENICVKITPGRMEASLNQENQEFGRSLERVMEHAAQTVEYTEDGNMYAVFAGIEPMVQGSFW